MFFRQMIEDYTFDDLKFVYDNDRYFAYLSEQYKLTDEDKENFNLLLNSKVEYKKVSLEVLTLRKIGLFSRVYLINEDDELRSIKDFNLEELSAYPVDLAYSSDVRRSLQLIICLLLEFSYYNALDKKDKEKNDLRKYGGVEMESGFEEDNRDVTGKKG